MLLKHHDHPLANRTGFTLVELLVVIGIIGILVGLTLPAVEMARESARRGSCGNNLKQLGFAAKLHTDAHRHFPTGGWGDRWVGDPDGGFGPKQPGGWVYNVLPYLEEASLRELGSGEPTERKAASLAKLMETAVPVLNCPSRRAPRAYPYRGPTTLENANPPRNVAKSDYVINTVVSSERSQIITAEIQLDRGMSKTLLIGEKSLARSHYTTGQGAGDRLSMYSGDGPDIGRRVTQEPIPDRKGGSGFGGPHPAGCNVVYCDGSVRFVSSEGPLEP